jgi:Endosomal/lysosomal potassium channel TMEM175
VSLERCSLPPRELTLARIAALVAVDEYGRRSLPGTAAAKGSAAFSDGVLAIAATLLVLDLAAHPPGTPLQQVLHGWPGYVVSFLTIGGVWLLHTALTERLTRADPILAPLPHSRRETPDHAA